LRAKEIAVQERFNYLCSDAELKEWVPKVRELASKTKQLHVLFNNNYEDEVARNASQMRLMLDQVSVAVLRVSVSPLLDSPRPSL